MLELYFEWFLYIYIYIYIYYIYTYINLDKSTLKYFFKYVDIFEIKTTFSLPLSFKHILSLFLWLVEVPDADPLGFRGSGLLPTLVSCQILRERDMEMGWGWSTACPALIPDGCYGSTLLLSVHFFSHLIYFTYLFFSSFNHIILPIKHCHTYTLSHSLIRVHSKVQLTARDQYEQCYPL